MLQKCSGFSCSWGIKTINNSITDIWQNICVFSRYYEQRTILLASPSTHSRSRCNWVHGDEINQWENGFSYIASCWFYKAKFYKIYEYFLNIFNLFCRHLNETSQFLLNPNWHIFFTDRIALGNNWNPRVLIGLDVWKLSVPLQPMPIDRLRGHGSIFATCYNENIDFNQPQQTKHCTLLIIWRHVIWKLHENIAYNQTPLN